MFVSVVKCLRFAFLLCRNHKIKYALHFMWVIFLVTKTKEVKGRVDEWVGISYKDNKR